jgi:nucleotide-binding universal stress UspA family protein
VDDHATIVTGYDGSEQARDGLALARLLSRVLDADVVALSVINYSPTETEWAQYERVLQTEGERLQSEVRDRLAPANVETVVLPAGSPPRELNNLAEARGAKLIVLGSTHRGALGRVLPGTVADRLLTAAPCAVAVAPRGYAAEAPAVRSVAVAYDGSPESEAALAMASKLALATKASITLVTVVNPHDALVVVPMAGAWAGMVRTEERVELERERLQSILDAALDSLPVDVSSGGQLELNPDPTAVIVDASEEADILFIGSRRYGPVDRVVLGSMSSRVIREARCPVIVTPRTLAPP